MLLLINLVMLGIELILYRFVLHLIVDSVFELFLHGGSQSLYLLELIIDLPTFMESFSSLSDMGGMFSKTQISVYEWILRYSLVKIIRKALRCNFSKHSTCFFVKPENHTGEALL